MFFDNQVFENVVAVDERILRYINNVCISSIILLIINPVYYLLARITEGTHSEGEFLFPC